MSGRRLALNKPWYDTEIVNCSFCGIMVARDYWADDDYPGDRFCEQECADVKRRLAAEQAGSAPTSSGTTSDV